MKLRAFYGFAVAWALTVVTFISLYVHGGAVSLSQDVEVGFVAALAPAGVVGAIFTLVEWLRHPNDD